ncbi:MAG: MBL fold metallo-hydrolase [Thermoplasmatales archaeon]|jgi:7,8-dihydropterin-6-yl-methyl-4-(beta-D-ribofuranosyl)aminobenzene 5'-phosphate synthase|nr:MBL fold metallo-hydrolase [Thermoplasmatales archaeon]
MYKLNGIILFLIFTISFIPSATAEDLDLTIIYDNNLYNEKLETRWGFSCLVEGLEKTILFDVGGDGSVLLRNMEKLKIAPREIDVVILSHIHYDHIGGLSDFLRKNPLVTVYMPSSLPRSVKDKVKNAGAKLIEVRRPTEICKNAYSTGELGTWIKEESLIMKTSKGLVIITGCAHSGVVNIVKKAKEMLKSRVYLVLGGFHLCWMNTWQIKGIVNGIEKEKVEKVAPCHCSGDLARKLFKKAYGKDFILVGCGKKIKIKDAF